MAILPRQYNVCYDSFGRAYTCNSTWNSWGRWVATGVILAGAFILFLLIACCSARRRRKAGRQPFYGTGWAGRPWNGQAQYNPNYGQQQYQAPPAYGQNQGGYYGQNQGYYGARSTDVEMQPPQNTYQGGENVYTPPPGPPPNKR